MGKYAMGVLCHGRPLHTALTLAFAFKNKSDLVDLFAFYGVHRTGIHPSKTLTDMLVKLQDAGHLPFFYMHEDKAQNTQGNVDTLMLTLNSMDQYEYYFKIDDDVLIGKGSDEIMANIMRKVEGNGVCMMMGQVVRKHIHSRNPFVWDAHVHGHHVVQRGRKACPMETYTIVSKRALALMRENGNSVSCDNTRGTYGVYTKKISTHGHKVGLVLDPAIQMQHIGLTTTIEASESARCWAPATSWNPPDKVIEIPGFDFKGWEASHKDSTQKEFTIATLEGLRSDFGKHTNALDMLLKSVKEYEPGSNDVALPPDPGTPKESNVRRRRRKIVRPRTVAQGDPTTITPTTIPTTVVQKIDMNNRNARGPVMPNRSPEGAVGKLPEGQLVRRVRSSRNVAVRKEK